MKNEAALNEFQSMLINKYMQRELLNEDKLEIKNLINNNPKLYKEFREELLNEIKKNSIVKAMRKINEHSLEKINAFSILDENMLIKIERKKSKNNNDIIFINDCMEIKEDSSKNTVNFFTFLKSEDFSVKINLFIKNRGENETPNYNIVLNDFTINNYNSIYMNFWKSKINELLISQIDIKARDNLIKINKVLHEALKYPDIMKKITHEKPLKKILMELKDFYDIILLSSDSTSNKEIVKTVDLLLKEIKNKVNKLDSKI